MNRMELRENETLIFGVWERTYEMDGHLKGEEPLFRYVESPDESTGRRILIYEALSAGGLVVVLMELRGVIYDLVAGDGPPEGRRYETGEKFTSTRQLAIEFECVVADLEFRRGQELVKIAGAALSRSRTGLIVPGGG